MLLMLLLSGFLTFTEPVDFWMDPEIIKCCSQADAVYADDWTINADGSANVTVTDKGPKENEWAPIGRTYVVPKEKIILTPGNPTGRALLFLSPYNLDNVYCFVMGPLI